VSVKLHIGRVLIEGIPLDRAGAARFRAALEGELRRLIADGGLPEAWRGAGAHPDAPAGAVSLTPGMSGASLGLEVARAVAGAPGQAGPGR
jgi:hypothetical protein